MAELSVFIDESGEFGPYEHHAPHYTITLVFHDQSTDIVDQIDHLRRHLVERGFSEDHAVHFASLVRRERDYVSMDLTARRKLSRSLFTFMRLCGISYKSFVFRKREFADHDKMVSRISREVSSFATGAAVVAAAKSMTSKSMIRNVPNTIFGTPFDMFIGDNKDALDNPVPQ